MSKTLLESYLAGEWEEITEEQKREFREKSMERIGDIIEMYIEKARRGMERIRIRKKPIGYYSLIAA